MDIHPSNARPGVGFCVRIANRVGYPGYCITTRGRTRRAIRNIGGSLNLWVSGGGDRKGPYPI